MGLRPDAETDKAGSVSAVGSMVRPDDFAFFPVPAGRNDNKVRVEVKGKKMQSSSVSDLAKSTKRWAYAIGAGMALSPIHNKYLTDLATNSKGEVTVFLPAIAFVILIMGTGLFLSSNWHRVKSAGLGDKRVVLPLLVIVAAIGLSGVNAATLAGKTAPLLMGLSLFGLYLASRILGKELFYPLAIGAAVASFGVILFSVLHPGQWSGGYVFGSNFDILTGYVLLGAALFFHRYRWLLAGLALVAIFLSGSPEGLLPIGTVAVALLVRRDWSRKLAIVSGALAVVAVIIFSLGFGSALYNYTWRVVTNDTSMVQGTIPGGGEATGSPLTWRWKQIKIAAENFTPFGEGYYATSFKITTVHNVPLLMIQQMGYPGIVASLAWIWVSFWCLLKTKWKYVWLLILSLSVFDHYIWTQLGPVWWTVVGASLSSSNSDLLFCEERT